MESARTEPAAPNGIARWPEIITSSPCLNATCAAQRSAAAKGRRRNAELILAFQKEGEQQYDDGNGLARFQAILIELC